MQYSPKLKKAIAQIKDILDEHDIAGAVVLHTPGHGEHLFKIDPSYSCAFIDNSPGVHGIRVRTRLQEDYSGDARKRHQAQEDTVNMFDIMSHLVGTQAMYCIETMKMLEKNFDITRSGTGGTSSDVQNN